MGGRKVGREKETQRVRERWRAGWGRKAESKVSRF